MRELFALEYNVVIKPTFAAYNIKVQKIVVCCMPITCHFRNWISKQTQALPDGYLHPEAKNIIRYEYFLCAWFLLKGLHNADYLYLIGCWKKCCHNEFILYDDTCLNILEK